MTPKASKHRKRTPASEDRWREILEASTRIFYDKGYEATGIQDIANAVGILKGSLYYYIDSKEDLLYAVVKEVHDGAMAILEQARASDADPLTKLRDLVQAHITYEADNHEKIAVFHHDFRSLSEERAAEIVAPRNEYERVVQDLVEEGQRQGLIRPDLDPSLVTKGLFGMINWIYDWYSPQGAYRPGDLAREYGEILTSGVLDQPPPSGDGRRSAGVA